MAFSGSVRFFILFALVIESAGYGLVGPVVPRLLEKFSASGAAGVSVIYGWSLAIFSLAVSVCSPLAGRLSDRFGRRPVVLMSLAGSVLDYVVAATTDNLWVFLISRAVAGALAAGRASMLAAVADVTPPDRRAHHSATTGAASSTGFVVGPLVGGLAGEFGPAMPFWIAAVLNALALVLGLFIFKETLPVSERRALAQGSLNPIAALYEIRRFPLGGMLGVFLLLTAGLAIADPIGILFMQTRFGWSTSQIGLYTFIAGAGIVVARLTLTRLALARLGERQTILWGMISLLICMILCSVVWQGWQMYIVLTFMLLGSVTFPTLFGVLSKEVPANEQGELQGSLGAIQSAAGVIGAPVSTYIFAYFTGPSAPVTLYAAPMLTCAAFLIAACFALLRTGANSAIAMQPNTAQVDASRARSL